MRKIGLYSTPLFEKALEEKSVYWGDFYGA
jgi:hypothetical protein